MKSQNYFSMIFQTTIFQTTIFRVATILALMCVACFAQTASLQTIHIVALYPHLPIVVAQEHGIFAKYGLDVQIENVPTSDVLRDQLSSGRRIWPTPPSITVLRWWSRRKWMSPS